MRHYIPFVAIASVFPLPSNAQSHNATECTLANEFLCATQCGKVLIQCTALGTGVTLPPLDDQAAVCNNGKIDYVTNCVVAAAVATPIPLALPPPQTTNDQTVIAFLTANINNGGKSAIVSLTNPNVQPPIPPTRTASQICAELLAKAVPELPNEGLFFCVDLFRFGRCHNGQVIINQFMPFDVNPLVRACANNAGFCAGVPSTNPCVIDAAKAVAASKTVEYFLLPTVGVMFNQA
ncbi:hypothetical protein HDU79_002780 [Rhizoclosmatium sp. JEL0117]|nr:hypothetical protein HDU79_002780 [Rhizoclosmatium sp. JEL0117]